MISLSTYVLYTNKLIIIIIIIIIFRRYRGSRGIFQKNKRWKTVGVTITTGSPEQRNRAAERCYIAARARKRAGTKMQSSARRPNVIINDKNNNFEGEK